MLQIKCPWCGVRDEVEFRFGGESHLVRPGAEVSDSEWADYLFNRTNPKGVHYERWCHHHGCGQWFNVARHTVSHNLVAIYPMGDPRPDLSGDANQ